jgi:hypothetical protein
MGASRRLLGHSFSLEAHSHGNFGVLKESLFDFFSAATASAEKLVV